MDKKTTLDFGFVVSAAPFLLTLGAIFGAVGAKQLAMREFSHPVCVSEQNIQDMAAEKTAFKFPDINPR